MRLPTALFLLATTQVWAAESAPSFAANARVWAADKLWDDGLAEVSEYRGERVIYGAPRAHRAVLIVVKEDFANDLQVKADRFEGRELTTVLKLNWQALIPTPNYDYHYLTSVFVRRADLRAVVKLSTASQEWCGNTFQLFKGWTQPPQLETHSYFDGEGDRIYPLAMEEGDLLEDQLPLSLRALPFETDLEVAVRVLDSRRQNRARPPHWQDAQIRVAGSETMDAGNLGEVSAWQIELQRGPAVDRYWFESAYPNRLLRFEAADGRRLMLAHVERRAYWKLPQ